MDPDTLADLFKDHCSIDEAIVVAQDSFKEKKEQFGKFWEKSFELLNSDYVTVPDERRHGSTCYMGPSFTSLRDFHETVSKKLEENDPKPSLEYFRLQFTPRNTHALTSKRYYKRFEVKWGLQTRTLHKMHIDQHYGSKQFCFLKEYAQKFKHFSYVMFVDDKAQVPIGDVGAPVSAVTRQRRVMQVNNELRSLDHDNAFMHLTPSVNVLLEPPENQHGWYAGVPEIVLKESIFQPSTAFRHVAEIANRLDKHEKKPFLFIGSDGGPDHNLTFIQTIMSYIALFLVLDLDFFFAVRTPPGLSIINPAERVMSHLNVGLYGTALARDDIGVNEKYVRNVKFY